MKPTLLLHEPPFISISGEAGGFPQGSFCTFIRLQKCNLRCKYCDTPKARPQEGGILYSIDSLVQKCHTKQVLITGGEPLLQAHALVPLIERLTKEGHPVQIETNGSLPIPSMSNTARAYSTWIIDRKGSSSGMSHKMLPPTSAAYHCNTDKVIFKYVLAGFDSKSYQEDRYFLTEDMRALHNAGYRGRFLISPMDAAVDKAGNLNCFPIEFQDRITISLQLHKILGFA